MFVIVYRVIWRMNRKIDSYTEENKPCDLMGYVKTEYLLIRQKSSG